MLVSLIFGDDLFCVDDGVCVVREGTDLGRAGVENVRHTRVIFVNQSRAEEMRE